jgi:iron complex outermembrane receptor protein
MIEGLERMNCRHRVRPRRLSLMRRLMFASTAAWFAASAPAAAQPATSAPGATAQSFNIPAQPLREALRQLMKQASLQIAFEGVDLDGKTSSAVSGNLGTGEALSRLLTGTGLTFRYLTAGSVVLERAPQSPDGAVQLGPIRVEGDDAGARTLAGGRDLPPPYSGGQVARGGSIGILGNRDYMDTPYSQSSITSVQMEDRQTQTLADAVATDPAVFNVYEQAGYYAERFTIRGFNVNQTTQSDILVNGLYGLASNYINSSQIAERIEVLKGPNALLNGAAPSGSLGGAINIVTKQAEDEPLTRVSADFNSDSLFGGDVDMSRRFGEGGEWGIRINGRYGDGGTTTDFGRTGTRLGALALDYRGDSVRLKLDVIGQRNLTRRLPSYVALWSYQDTVLPEAPSARINTSDPATRSSEGNLVGLLSGDLDISSDWTIFAAAGLSRWGYKAAEMGVTVFDRSGDLWRDLYGFNIGVRRQTYRLGIRGHVDTGAISHIVNLSADRYVAHQRDSQSLYILADGSLYKTENGAPAPIVVPETSYMSGDIWNARRNSTFDSLAVADTLSVLDGSVQLTLGVRLQRIKQQSFAENDIPDAYYNRSALTPTIALLGRLSPKLSVFANYIQGLNQGATAPALTLYPDLLNPGAQLAPFKSKQYEAGLKFDGGSFGATLGVFRIERPSASVGADNFFAVNGLQRNRGVELTLFGEPVSGVRLIGGVSLLNARLHQTSTGANEGNRVVGGPTSQLKLNAEWDLSGVPGLTLTAAVSRAGKQYANAANTLSIAPWTIWDVGARYSMPVGDHTVTMRANIHNVTNKDRYWASAADYGGLLVGVPRAIQVSVSVDF